MSNNFNSAYKKWHKPDMRENARTRQGYYKVQHLEKYVGDPTLIIYRSSWELTFLRWCDFSPSIIKFSSEPIRIPYYDRTSKLEECKKYGLNPNDPKNWEVKNYNVDFWLQIQKDENVTEKWFVEIKPSEKLKKPVPPPENSPLKIQRKFVNEAREFLLNEAKFAAMNAYANKVNAKFYIFTEIQLEKLTRRFFIPK